MALRAVLPTLTHTHAFTHIHTEICKSYCFSTATMVSWMHPIVMLHVHCLSYYLETPYSLAHRYHGFTQKMLPLFSACKNYCSSALKCKQQIPPKRKYQPNKLYSNISKWQQTKSRNNIRYWCSDFYLTLGNNSTWSTPRINSKNLTFHCVHKRPHPRTNKYLTRTTNILWWH